MLEVKGQTEPGRFVLVSRKEKQNNNKKKNSETQLKFTKLHLDKRPEDGQRRPKRSPGACS